jgi:hypothetical protein
MEVDMIVFSTKLGLASRGMMVLLTATSMAANSDLAQDNKKAPAPAEVSIAPIGFSSSKTSWP